MEQLNKLIHVEAKVKDMFEYHFRDGRDLNTQVKLLAPTFWRRAEIPKFAEYIYNLSKRVTKKIIKSCSPYNNHHHYSEWQNAMLPSSAIDRHYPPATAGHVEVFCTKRVKAKLLVYIEGWIAIIVSSATGFFCFQRAQCGAACACVFS